MNEKVVAGQSHAKALWPERASGNLGTKRKLVWIELARVKETLIVL